MKSEKLLKEIGNIDDDLITDADKSTFKRKSKLGLKIMVPLAASIAVVSLLFYNYDRVSIPLNMNNITRKNDGRQQLGLKKITLDKIENHGCGQTIGYAYNIKDLINGNPWSEGYGITNLPVYKHAVDHTDINNYTNGVLDKMKERATYIANKMGLKIDKFYTAPTDEQLKDLKAEYGSIEKIPNKGSLNGIHALCGNIEIYVDLDLDTVIEFHKGIKLPKDYNFKYASSIDDASKVIDYLINEYNGIINVKNPKKSIPTNFDYTGQIYIHHDLYDASGDIYNQIKNYNFNRISFIPEKGMLGGISIGSFETLTTVGNYPIITLEEAKNRLYEKKYYANVPGDVPEEKYIGKVEIVYPYTADTFVIPYYRFYIELPSSYVQLEKGMITYGIYDVPAVKTEYIDNISILHATMH